MFIKATDTVVLQNLPLLLRMVNIKDLPSGLCLVDSDEAGL